MRIQTIYRKGNILLLLAFSAALVIIVCASLICSYSASDITENLPDNASIEIVEVMANNKSAFINSDGLVCDYAIIRNSGDTEITLNGWGLSDRTYEIRFTFPDIILLPDEQFPIFFPGKEKYLSDSKELYTNFGISSSGEILSLFSPQGEIIQTIHVPASGKNEAYVQQNGRWQITAQQAYKPNTNYAGSFSSGIWINEVMISNISYIIGKETQTADIIEIYNGTDYIVDLSDYTLSDNLDHPDRFSFEENTFIAPGEYRCVLCTSENPVSPELICNAAFSLDSSGESLFLYRKSTDQIVDMVTIPPLEADYSYARIDDEWLTQSSPTPGFSNDSNGLAALDAALRAQNISGVYISEVCTSNFDVVLPHVKGYYDYIELYNAGTTSVDLTGYTLSNNPKQPRKWQLNNLHIGPRSSRLIYCEPENQGMDTEEVHYANFHLSAGGCGIYLFDPTGTLIDRIRVPISYSNTSYGRTLGQAGLYVYDMPSPGSPNGIGFSGYSKSPEFSLSGGLYDRPVTVSITAPEDAKVFFTLDGSIPTQADTKYSEPILIEKTTVLRACAFENGLAASPATTQTYFISTYHTLPVISLTTDPDHLWNEEYGMLADGPLLDRDTQSRPWLKATYSQKNKYSGYIEYYDENDTQQLSQGMLFQCMGQFSLDMPQKSFSIEANSQFGSSTFNFAAFEDRPYDSYSAYALRNGGQDGLYTRVLDGLQARLVEQSGSSVITQAWKSVIVYLNGHYWGHYNLRERVSIEMIAQHEGWIESEDIDLLEGNGTGSGNVNHGSNSDYRELIKYIEAHSLAEDSEALDYVLSKVDVDNMIDYFFFEMFFGNEDSGNIRFYRNAVEGDGRWRYVFYDLDWGLFHSEYGGPAHVLNPKGMGTHRITSNALLIALLEVDAIRERFLIRGGELFQSVLTTNNMIAQFDNMIAEIQPEMQMHFGRWAAEMYPQISMDQPKNPEGAYVYWQQRVDRAKNVMKKRPAVFWNMMKAHFKLSEEEMVFYFGACPVIPKDAI